MRKSLFAGVTLALTVVASDAVAQSPVPFSLEGRVDYAAPTGDFGDVMEEGHSFSGGVSIGISPGLGVYGSFSQTRFGTDLGEDGDNADAIDQGFSAGLTTALPRFAGVAPWVGAGAVFHQLEIGGSDEGIDEDIGFEVGGGLALSLARNVRLTPGVGYRRYATEISPLGGLVESKLDVEYFTAAPGRSARGRFFRQCPARRASEPASDRVLTVIRTGVPSGAGISSGRAVRKCAG
jgi:hypothetical protein